MSANVLQSKFINAKGMQQMQGPSLDDHSLLGSGHTGDSLVLCIFGNIVMEIFLIEEMILQSTVQDFLDMEEATLDRQWERCMWWGGEIPGELSIFP